MKRFAIFAVVACSAVALAEDEGWFGLAYRTGVSWTLKVEEASIALVAPGSPAARAGILVGDIIMAVEGCGIPGCGAYKSKGLLRKKIGETLHMKLKRMDGTEYSAALVAEAEPAEFAAYLKEAQRKAGQEPKSEEPAAR